MPDLLVLVNGLPGAGKTTLAQQLGSALGGVVISKDAIKEALAAATGPGVHRRAFGPAAMEAAWVLASAVRHTVILESWWFAPRDAEFVRAGISTIAPCRVVEVWCDAGTDLARARYAARQRADLHHDAERLRSDWDEWATRARPLGLSPVVTVDTSGPVDAESLTTEVTRAGNAQPSPGAP